MGCNHVSISLLTTSSSLESLLTDWKVLENVVQLMCSIVWRASCRHSQLSSPDKLHTLRAIPLLKLYPLDTNTFQIHCSKKSPSKYICIPNSLQWDKVCAIVDSAAVLEQFVNVAGPVPISVTEFIAYEHPTVKLIYAHTLLAVNLDCNHFCTCWCISNVFIPLGSVITFLLDKDNMASRDCHALSLFLPISV